MTEGEPRGAPRVWPWWAGFFAAVAGALRLSYLAYNERLPSALERFDKVVHCTLAGVLAFFLDGALRRRSFVVRDRRVSVAAVTLLAIFAVEEFLQRFSATRTPDVRDYAADVVGVVLFTWLSRRIGRSSEPRGADAAHDRAE